MLLFDVINPQLPAMKLRTPSLAFGVEIALVLTDAYVTGADIVFVTVLTLQAFTAGAVAAASPVVAAATPAPVTPVASVAPVTPVVVTPVLVLLA
jgi:hypothetical protein